MEINEGISDIVYHFTTLGGLNSILDTNKFKLSTNLGSTADLNTSKGKFYFFSTTRSKSKQYSNRQVKIVLNGQKLGNNYKSFPIDYWAWSKNPKDYSDKSGYVNALLSGEEEDRIVSNKPYIEKARNYILEIHIFLDKNDFDIIQQNTIDNLIDKVGNIPLYFYNNKKSFLLQNKKDIINISNYNFKNSENTNFSYDPDLRFNLWRVASLLSYKDDEMRSKVVSILSKKYNLEEVNQKIDKTLNDDNYNYFYRFKNENDIMNKEYVRLIENEIHTKRSSKNELEIEIINLLVQYMNKNKLKNISQFLFKKIKGDFKYLNEFRSEYLNQLYKFIDEKEKEYIKQYNQYRYTIEDETTNNVFYEFPELRSLIRRYLNKTKEYIKNLIDNKEIDFKYLSGYITSDAMKDFIGLNQISFDNLFQGYDIKLSEDLEDDIKRIIERILYDLDSESYSLKEKYNQIYYDQFNVNEGIIKESINPNNSYDFNIFKKNNKIGFYDFKNKDGIEYDVRISQYYDEIDGDNSKILDIEFAANDNWKQSNISDKFNVLSTIASILNDYYSDNKDVDYITYVLDRNDNPEKRNKLYQYIVKSIGLKVSEIKTIGSNVYLKINKNNSLVERIIKEELENIPPHQYSYQMKVDDIINYLYNNDKYNIKNGIIKDYNIEDNIKSLHIKIFGKDNGPYPNNKFLIYPYLEFKILSKENGYNIGKIEIIGEQNGYFKDLKKGEGYNIKFLEGFSSKFYKLLRIEIENNFRFDNKPKSDPSKLPISKNNNINDEVIRIEPSKINYIESVVRLDNNSTRRNKILKLTEKVKKQNYYTKRSLLTYFENYLKGNIK